MSADIMKDYVQVNERIAAFRKEHPEGSLQSEIVTMTDKLVVMKGYAYRTPDDIRPGIGFSSLEIPGRTPYTRGSELENAETSAWGRALAALGYEVKRGIATAEEITNKQGDAPAPYRPTFDKREVSAPVMPVTPGVLHVTKISSTSGTNARTGKPWTKYLITTDDGKTFSTFSETNMLDAAYAKDNGLSVTVNFHESQYGNDLDGLTVAGPIDPTRDAPVFDPDLVPA